MSFTLLLAIVDSDILRRESSLKEIKDEIERERRTQEVLLRELKQTTSGDASSTTNNKTEGRSGGAGGKMTKR